MECGWCIVVIGVYKALLCRGVGVVTLLNEKCGVRPELINVASDGDYYPEIIELHRCGGACPGHGFRKCIVETSNNISVNVLNKYTYKNETKQFQNHTSCTCKCIYNAAVCSKTLGTNWNESQCKCICKKSTCSSGYMWNTNNCNCECALDCKGRQYLNDTGCNCICEPRYYKRCNRKNKLLRESDCKCYRALWGSKLSISPCEILPDKWVGIIIVMLLCTFAIVVIDCILYCKNTGCIYILTRRVGLLC